jgi:hypothetical protein
MKNFLSFVIVLWNYRLSFVFPVNSCRLLSSSRAIDGGIGNNFCDTSLLYGSYKTKLSQLGMSQMFLNL